MKSINHHYKKPILKLIQKHQGKNNPIQVSEIMEFIPLSDRDIRKVVQYLINKMHYPIGSTTKGPHGFFMIVKIEDYLEAVSNLIHRKEKISERVNSLREACLKSGLSVPSVDIYSSGGQTVLNISNSIIINL